MKNFYRKVAFGLGPKDKVPSDPLKWATSQLNEIPEFSWKGKILPEKELRNYYRDYVYGDRKVLRKKFKNDKDGYKREKNKLRHATGQKFWWNLELCIRYSEALKSTSPVLAKLWYFWGNHFAISEKDFLAQYTTGAYQREIIRANMNQNFEKMVQAYWGTVLSVDDSVGRLVTFLKESGQYDNTLIVFMGDNGLLEGEHGMVDKRTMHEPSIRVPLIARGPGLPKGSTVAGQVLNEDIAPSILDLCGAEPLKDITGKSWRKLAGGNDTNWRTTWLYEYDYEKQFPYTPNIRGIRTDRWKFVRYPHGDGSPDRHTPEMYDLKNDPLELNNLAENPAFATRRAELESQLQTALLRLNLTPDRDTMPIDEGIKTELPDKKIR